MIVDDDKASRESISQFLKELGHNLTECRDGVSALKRFSPDYYDIIFSDIKMPSMSGIELVKKIRSLPGGSEVNIILFTGYSETDSAIEALRYGVYDYLLKPVNVEEIAGAIERILEHKLIKKKNELLNAKSETAPDENAAKTGGEDSEDKGHKLPQRLKKHKTPLKVEYTIGTNKIGVFSEEMKNIFNYAGMLHADRNIPVLIEGETGSGKEMVAQFIHYGQDANNCRPFVDINCACISANLFESELFGYAPGAFTGGLDKGQPGKLDIAGTGTIFLDEIADMPFEMQAKLLRVIQEKEFYRVGGLKKIKTDLRIICATNVRLEERVIEARFRQDLYYRLNAGRIYIPALRERPSEIMPLANMFLTDIAGKRGKKFKYISAEAESLILAYNWPGNVRQLRNVIERAVFMYDSDALTPAHLDVITKTFDGRPRLDTASSTNGGGGQANLKTAAEDINLIRLPNGPFSLNEYIDSIIKKALILNEYNRTKTAKYLNITRRTLYTYLKRIGKISDG
jgi:DNA-binding NtrC family response regulator